jgi:hypothetical protein
MPKKRLAFLLSILLSSSTGIAQQREATLRKFLQQYAGSPTHDSEARYLSAFVDLNGDGKQEAIVYLSTMISAEVEAAICWC